jgi:hypothetical protein
MKNIIIGAFLISIGLSLNAQTFVDIGTIPKDGTILVNSHMDDDVIWMAPFWNITERFIIGAMPTTPDYNSLIHEQQVYLDANYPSIQYESNWEHPWGTITDSEYINYYWNLYGARQDYIYLSNEYLLCGPLSDAEIYNEMIRIKAKLEQFIARDDVDRIITHNNWGEYGHEHHRALNKAVRDLAVKYHKDVWMLYAGINIDYSLNDFSVPAEMTYTSGTFDPILYGAIRNIYDRYGKWTFSYTYTPNDAHPYSKIVDGGVDMTGYIPENVYPNGTYPDIVFPSTTILQDRPGAYILDGVTEYVTLSSNQNTSFTMSMWLMPDQIREMDISKMTEYPSSESYDRTLYMNTDGGITAELNDGSLKTLTSTTNLTANNWTHVALTCDGTSLKLFIDGELQDEISAGWPVTVYNTPEFVIGQASATTNFFEGQISDVRQFDYALSETDIALLAGVDPPQSFTITSSAGVGGTITPTGVRNVLQGNNIIYAIEAEPYYTIGDVVVDGVSQGPVTSFNFTDVNANHTISATFSTYVGNIALNKQTSCSSFEQEAYNASKANDEDGSNSSFWSGADVNPQWWEVDLGAIYDISYIVIRNLVFYSVTNARVYHYNIQASTTGTDSFDYTQIIEKSNDNISTNTGDRYNVNISARYLRVNIVSSTPNNTAHITDFRVYGTLAKTWTGSAGTEEWNTADNWSPTGVPETTDNIFIPSDPVGLLFPVFNGDLTINANTSLTINPGGALTVTGNLDNYGTLKLESGSNGIASLIVGDYTRETGGTENIEIYLTGGNEETNFTWHYISSPVSTLSTDVFTTGTNPSNNLAAYVESHSSEDFNQRWIAWDGWDYSIGGYPGTLVTFNNLEVGNGYNYYNYYTTKRTFGIEGGSLNASLVTKDLLYTGTEANLATQGWNLLGNPYSASINWDYINRSEPGIDDAIYFTKEGSFCAYVDGVGVPSGTTGIIPPMQGFFVKANQENCNVTFSPNDRLHSDVNRYKSSTIIPLIRLKIEGQKANNETVIRFNEKATEAFDSKYDAYKFTKSGSSVSLWTSIGSVSYSINSIPLPETESEVPLAINTSKSESLKLTATELQGLDNYNIYLIDKILGTSTNLKSNQKVIFTASEGMLEDRFLVKIVYNPPEIENPDSQFNVYFSNNFVNIQTLSDKWDGKSGSVDLIEISGKTITKIENIEFWKNSLLQIPATGLKGLFFVRIQSGLMRQVEKVMIVR